jgi:hypothetical protein
MSEQSVFDTIKMKRSHWLICGCGCLLLLVLLFSPGAAWGQRYSGSLTGLVTDPSGAIIPGANVTLVNVQNGFQYTAKTNATGRYLLRPLPPSTYTLSVTASGFRTFVYYSRGLCSQSIRVRQ